MSLWDYLGNVQTAFGKDVKNPNVPTKNDRVPFGPTLDIAKNLEEPTKSAFGVAKNRPVASGIGTRFAPSGSESKITNQNLEEFRKDAINVAASVLGFVGKIGGAAYKASPLGQLDKATGGKITGAGGGGFMMFYCPDNTRYSVKKALENFGGDFRAYQFTEKGLSSWQV